MENNYFKKGSVIAVQRLESAGIRLPPEPKYDAGKEEDRATSSQKVLSPYEKYRMKSNEIANALLQTGPAEPITPVKSSTAQAGSVRMVDQNNTESKGSATARYSHERYTNKTVKMTVSSLTRYV